MTPVPKLDSFFGILKLAGIRRVYAARVVGFGNPSTGGWYHASLKPTKESKKICTLIQGEIFWTDYAANAASTVVRQYDSLFLYIQDSVFNL
jgi:hypothetical protein